MITNTHYLKGFTLVPILYTGVRLYIQDGDIVLPNRTMISAATITASTGLWCQSALNETKIGKWLLPNDTAAPTTRTGPLFTTHAKGQIGLFRQGDIATFQGVYQCILPDEKISIKLYWCGSMRVMLLKNVCIKFLLRSFFLKSLFSFYRRTHC